MPILFRCVLASLYEALSVRRSIGRSVCPSVRWSVTLSSKLMKHGLLRILKDLYSTGQGKKKESKKNEKVVKKMKNEKVAKGRTIGLAGPCSFHDLKKKILNFEMNA